MRDLMIFLATLLVTLGIEYLVSTRLETVRWDGLVTVAVFLAGFATVLANLSRMRADDVRARVDLAKLAQVPQDIEKLSQDLKKIELEIGKLQNDMERLPVRNEIEDRNLKQLRVDQGSVKIPTDADVGRVIMEYKRLADAERKKL
jgi:hypothetical protein